MRRSVMEHAFSLIPRAEIPRSSFDRSHGYKTTFDAGYLIPIFLDEALPGDTMNVQLHAMARLATPIFPVMDSMYMDTFFFAVPYRLVWENWERFNGAQDDPDDSTDFLIPTLHTSTVPITGSLLDYMGCPLVSPLGGISALPVRAYNLIWNEWFRDQNLQDSIDVPVDNGPDGTGATAPIVLRRGKRHDYFTSCLPWPQKGDAVSMPLGTVAPIIPEDSTGLAASPTWVQATAGQNTLGGTLGSGVAANAPLLSALGTGAVNPVRISGLPGDVNTSGMVADLSEATAATINQLRQAFQIQRLLERDARGGTRYTEIVRSHFGVISPDARLQRPEYLGGGSTPINITSVPQTSQTDAAGTPQGNLAAFGTVNLHNHGFTKSFTEHCLVIGLVNVRADLTYQQGLERHWSRRTRFDFFWPALSHIGEQAVLNKEIFTRGIAGDDDVFGYQERYAEYRYKPSLVTGLFRSNPTAPATSLDAWHLAQDFASIPILGPNFIVDDPPIDRVIAVTDEPHFLFDAFFKFRHARPMPVFGVPGMIDHF